MPPCEHFPPAKPNSDRCKWFQAPFVCLKQPGIECQTYGKKERQVKR